MVKYSTRMVATISRRRIANTPHQIFRRRAISQDVVGSEELKGEESDLTSKGRSEMISLFPAK